MAAVEAAETEIAKVHANIDDKKWKYVSKHLMASAPEGHYSGGACKKRFEALQLRLQLQSRDQLFTTQPRAPVAYSLASTTLLPAQTRLSTPATHQTIAEWTRQIRGATPTGKEMDPIEDQADDEDEYEGLAMILDD